MLDNVGAAEALRGSCNIVLCYGSGASFRPRPMVHQEAPELQHGKQPHSSVFLDLLTAPQTRCRGVKRGRDGEEVGNCRELKRRQSLTMEEPRLKAGRDQAWIGAGPHQTTNGIHLVAATGNAQIAIAK